VSLSLFLVFLPFHGSEKQKEKGDVIEYKGNTDTDTINADTTTVHTCGLRYVPVPHSYLELRFRNSGSGSGFSYGIVFLSISDATVEGDAAAFVASIVRTVLVAI